MDANNETLSKHVCILYQPNEVQDQLKMKKKTEKDNWSIYIYIYIYIATTQKLSDNDFTQTLGKMP